MPSQRAANKKCIATWVDKSVKRQLEQLAKKQGKPLSQLVNELYEYHLNKATSKKP
jgi:predicted DNA-binding protein